MLCNNFKILFQKERKKQEEILKKYKGIGGQKSGYKEDNANTFRSGKSDFKLKKAMLFFFE